jgi:hypothetical protein
VIIEKEHLKVVSKRNIAIILTGAILVSTIFLAIGTMSSLSGEVNKRLSGKAILEATVYYGNGTILIYGPVEVDCYVYPSTADPSKEVVEASWPSDIKPKVIHGNSTDAYFSRSGGELYFGQGRVFWKNLSAHSWKYLKVTFANAFSGVPNVSIGPYLAKSENGHIEDKDNVDYGTGVTKEYFWYCTYTTGSGTAGVNYWAAY